MDRRIRMAMLAAGFALGALALSGCGSEAPVRSAEPSTTTTTPTADSPASATSSTEVEVQATDLPDDYEPDITDSPEGAAALPLAEQAVVELGEERSAIWVGRDAIRLRVVEPTDADDAALARYQAQTSVPLRIEAVRISDAWLNEAMLRLNRELPPETGLVIGDLEHSRLGVGIDRANAPDLDLAEYTETVRALVARYLPDGVARGMVADGVTVEEAVIVSDCASFGYENDDVCS